MKMALTGLGLLLAVIAMEGGLAAPAYAEVNINVNIGPPPPIVVVEPPTMLFLGEPGLYVAVGVPYDVYFVGGRYYYYHGSNWFWGPGYGGPWVHVVHKSLPPGLQRYKVVQLRDFREREYRVYKVQGPKFKGKKFDADPGPHGKTQRASSNGGGNSQGGGGNSQGGGNGKGGGRGKGR
jgi:uncharacterized membrane protein YgcG